MIHSSFICDLLTVEINVGPPPEKWPFRYLGISLPYVCHKFAKTLFWYVLMDGISDEPCLRPSNLKVKVKCQGQILKMTNISVFSVFDFPLITLNVIK